MTDTDDEARRELLLDVAASLAAAISVLEHASERKCAPQKVCPSDRMFQMMLNDYRASLERVRRILAEQSNPDTGESA